MSFAPYRHHCTLRGHTLPLNSVRFSEDGQFVVTGGDDWLVTVWSSTDGSILQTFNPELGPVTSVELFSRGINQWLFLAGASGAVQLWQKAPGEMPFEHTHMSAIFDPQVEALALSDSQELLAVVGGGRLVILRVNWDNMPSPTFTPFIRHPSLTEVALPSLARCVLFFNNDRSIMVGYLDSKQIVAWTIEPWHQMWTCRLRKRIGSMTWSSETRHLLVWNLEDGIDVYRLHDDGQLRHLHKLVVNIKRNFVKIVHLVQHGRMAVSGTDKGEVNVWDVESGVLVQTLIHGSGTDIIQIVVGHSPQSGSYQLASVSMKDRPEVKIWCASNKSEHEKRSPWKIAVVSVIVTFLLTVAGIWVVSAGGAMGNGILGFNPADVKDDRSVSFKLHSVAHALPKVRHAE